VTFSLLPDEQFFKFRPRVPLLRLHVLARGFRRPARGRLAAPGEQAHREHARRQQYSVHVRTIIRVTVYHTRSIVARSPVSSEKEIVGRCSQLHLVRGFPRAW